MARSLLPFGWGSSRSLLADTDPLMALHRQMNRLFDDFAHGFGGPSEDSPRQALFTPRIDVSETDGEIQIQAELPGIEEKDVEITLDDDVLMLRGERKFEKEDKQKNYHVMERSFGSFSRAIQLPFEAKPGDIRAEFSNGILRVTVPKPQGAQHKVHKISVRKGGAQGPTSPA